MWGCEQRKKKKEERKDSVLEKDMSSVRAERTEESDHREKGALLKGRHFNWAVEGGNG